MSDVTQAAERAAANAAGMKLYARQWLDAQAAEDVVQEALVSLLSQKTCPDDPLAWMYVAVRHAAIDRLRSHRRREQREEKAAKYDWFQSPADSVIDSQSLQEALEKLSPELREIVLLRIWGELGYEQIARIAQVSVGTAHQRFAKAINALRQSLDS